MSIFRGRSARCGALVLCLELMKSRSTFYQKSGGISQPGLKKVGHGYLKIVFGLTGEIAERGTGNVARTLAYAIEELGHLPYIYYGHEDMLYLS